MDLAERLGVSVGTGMRKYKADRAGRVKHECLTLAERGELKATLIVDGAASPLGMKADFAARNIETSMTLNAPENMNARPALSWLRRQLDSCTAKHPEFWDKHGRGMHVDVSVKYRSGAVRIPVRDLDDAKERLADSIITKFDVVHVAHLGKGFEERRKLPTVLEAIPSDFYEAVGQQLRPWQKPAPRVRAEKTPAAEASQSAPQEDAGDNQPENDDGLSLPACAVEIDLRP